MSPVISLLIPCSDVRPEAIYSSLYQRMDAIEPLGGAKFPVFFSVNGNFDPGDGFAGDCVLRHFKVPSTR